MKTKEIEAYLKVKNETTKTSVYTEIPSEAFDAVKNGQWSLEDFEAYIKNVEEKGMERGEIDPFDKPYFSPNFRP